MKHKSIREHDRARRRERLAFGVVRWFCRRGWISGLGLAGYGLAVEGYTDRPDVGPERFTIEKTAAQADF